MSVRRDQRWYQDHSDRVHEVLYGHVMSLANKDTRRERYTILREIYAKNIEEDDFPETEDDDFEPTWGSRNPIVANAVDTVHSKLAMNRPSPQVLTTKGEWKLQRKAENLQQWLGGEMKRLNIYDDLAPKVLKEAILTGTGALYVAEKGGRPYVEMTYCEYLFTDHREAYYNAVRSMYRVRPVDREVLKEMFPEHAQRIEESETKYIDVEYGGSYDATDSDLLVVVEAWRKGPNGRRVIAIEDFTIVNEKYCEEDFPFVFVRWVDRPRSFWGISLCERAAGQQDEVDQIAEEIVENIHLATPKLFYSAGSITEDKITNKGWQTMAVKGDQMPVPWVPEPNSQMTVMREDQLRQRIYEDNGISALSAASQKPAGLDSGAAIRTYQDVESERFYFPGQQYEGLFVTLCEKIIKIAEGLYEKGEREHLTVSSADKGRLTEIAFGDVHFGDNPYQIQVFPVSKLAKSPSGRLAQITEMMEAGLITDPADAAELLDFPDLEQHRSLANAPREFAKDLIQRALDGKDVAKFVNPYMDLDFGNAHGMLVYNRAMLDGADFDDLDKLNSLLGMIRTHLEAAAAANMPPPAPAPAGMPPDAGIPAGPAGPPIPANVPPIPPELAAGGGVPII